MLQRIGGGGMGVVYKAEDVRLGRFVALKFLPPEMTDDAQALERFRREARAASALNHPSICTIYDLDTSTGRPFIVMELIEGQSLKSVIAAHPLPKNDILHLAIQISDGLEAAHSAGIVHRDIKPSNILVTRRRQAKILDFGLAKFAQRKAAEDTTQSLEISMTSDGATVGTVSYMSPEQARGEDLDFRTDLFSFGLVLYEMATGRMAFGGNTPAVVFDSILHSTPPSPLLLNSELPIELVRIIQKSIEKNREERYQTALDLRSDLKRLARSLELSQSGIVPASSATEMRPAVEASLSAEIERAVSKAFKSLLESQAGHPHSTAANPTSEQMEDFKAPAGMKSRMGAAEEARPMSWGADSLQAIEAAAGIPESKQLAGDGSAMAASVPGAIAISGSGPQPVAAESVGPTFPGLPASAISAPPHSSSVEAPFASSASVEAAHSAITDEVAGLSESAEVIVAGDLAGGSSAAGTIRVSSAAHTSVAGALPSESPPVERPHEPSVSDVPTPSSASVESRLEFRTRSALNLAESHADFAASSIGAEPVPSAYDLAVAQTVSVPATRTEPAPAADSVTSDRASGATMFPAVLDTSARTATDEEGSELLSSAADFDREKLLAELSPPEMSSRRLLLVGFAVGVLIVVGLLWLRRSPSATPSSGPAPLRIAGYLPLTHDSGDKLAATQGPVIAAAVGTIYYQERDSPAFIERVTVDGRPLPRIATPLVQPNLIDISPDGSRLLVNSLTGLETQLYLQPAGEGRALPLGQIVGHDGTWFPNGRRMLFANGGTLWSVGNDGAGASKLATAGGRIVWPRVSPDGKTIRFSLLPPGESSYDRATLWEVGAGGGTAEPLFTGQRAFAAACCGAWTRDGRFFIFQAWTGGSTRLWALPAGSSSPFALDSDDVEFWSPAPARDPAELFTIGREHADLFLRLDPASRRILPGSELNVEGIAEGPVYTRDGSRIVYIRSGGKLWSAKPGGENATHIAAGLAVSDPRWSADGRSLAFVAQSSGQGHVYVLETGSGFNGSSPRRLGPASADCFSPTWSPDGQKLAFACSSGGAHNIQIVDIASKESQLLPGSESIQSPRWSPDGAQLLGVGLNRHRLSVFGFKTASWRVLTRDDAVIAQAEWTPDGRAVVYLRQSEQGSANGSALVRVGTSGGQPTTLADLPTPRAGMTLSSTWMGMAPDGSPLVRQVFTSEQVYLLRLK
jgi:serine/threonine protein kinase/Tol biopolymer transport system component